MSQHSFRLSWLNVSTGTVFTADRQGRSRELKIEFTRLSPSGRPPARAHPDDAGFDLLAAEAAEIKPSGRADVGTGIAVAIPRGHAGLVLPRSGLALRRGVTLANSPGLIDPGYRGEVRIILMNTDRERPFKVEPGDRIAQMLIVQTAPASFREISDLGETARGMSGFGSTGVATK